jgi:hypothetical protein
VLCSLSCGTCGSVDCEAVNLYLRQMLCKVGSAAGETYMQLLVAGYYTIASSVLNLILWTTRTNARKEFLSNLFRISLKMDMSSHTFIPEFTPNKWSLFLFLTAFLYTLVVFWNVLTASKAYPAFYSMDTGILSRGVRRLECEGDHWPPSHVTFTNEWSYIFTPPACLHGVDMDNFYVYLIHCSVPRWPHKI